MLGGYDGVEMMFFSSRKRTRYLKMLQYLVNDYLGGYGLPQLRKIAGCLRLGVNVRDDRQFISMLDNRMIGLSHTEVVAVRLCPCPVGGLRIYLLFSDMTECWFSDRQLRKPISQETLQLYLESSE